MFLILVVYNVHTFKPFKFFKLANNTRKNMKIRCKVDGRWEADANALFGKCDVIFVKSFHYKDLEKGLGYVNSM